MLGTEGVDVPTESNVCLLKARAPGHIPAAFILYPERQPNRTSGIGVMFNPVGTLFFFASKEKIVRHLKEEFGITALVFDAETIRRFHQQAGTRFKAEERWLTIGISLDIKEDIQVAALQTQDVLEEHGFEVEKIPIPLVEHMQAFILPPSLRSLT
ncbi:hypothetical protein K8Q93_02920 [Candidatus Parcubacteria bacterium]|nr:hypothetical protein [Candidatus Parcubacteria bacterium]